MTEGDKRSREAIARIEGFVHQAESLPDAAARAATIELVKAVMEIHSLALGRIVEILCANGGVEPLLEDDLVSSILVLHDVHPENVDARVARAMSKLTRYFDSRGGRIEVLDLESDFIRVGYTGRHRSGATKEIIENAIAEAAPEITSVVVEGLEEEPAAGFVPLSVLTAAQT